MKVYSVLLGNVNTSIWATELEAQAAYTVLVDLVPTSNPQIVETVVEERESVPKLS